MSLHNRDAVCTETGTPKALNMLGFEVGKGCDSVLRLGSRNTTLCEKSHFAS